MQKALVFWQPTVVHFVASKGATYHAKSRVQTLRI